MQLALKRIFQSGSKKNYFWEEVNPNVVEAQYAVRGEVPLAAAAIRNQIKNNPRSHGYPFSETISCNIGNPQEFGHKPITFNRQALSCLLDTSRKHYLEFDLDNYAVDSNLTDNQKMQQQHTIRDASIRADKILQEIKSIGSYTDSLGIPSIRQSVARFIQKEDQVPIPSIDHIFLTNGASQGVHLLFQTLITCRDDAIMIPIPQYPLYSATISLYGGTLVPYFLNEERGWQLDLEELEKSIAKARTDGKRVKAIVMINPGNPTGAIFSQETIRNVIDFGVKNKIVIVADEVYRENVYKANTVFTSFRKALGKMTPSVKDQCELASLHSTSKGLLGECGLRGGYLYLHNFNPYVVQELVKLSSICLCANTIGQGILEFMVNPPNFHTEHPKTVELYKMEANALYGSLKERAGIVTNALQKMKNISCNEVEGAMYAFPRIQFSPKAIEAAKTAGKIPDVFYCLQALKETGIVLVPGSGFKQKPDTYHFRITTLVNSQKLQQTLDKMHEFNEKFHAKYEEKP